MASSGPYRTWDGTRGVLARASVLACALGWGFGGTALASPKLQPGINWVRLDGAESCLSAAALVERVEARVRELQFSSARDADLFVDGSVRRAAEGGWDVRLEVSARDGSIYGRRDMHFDGEACSVIDEGVALVIAVTLYPGSGLANAGIPLGSDTAQNLDALFGGEPSEPAVDSVPVPAGPPPSAAAEPRPASPAPRGAQPSAEQEARAPWNLFVDVAAFGAFGQLPGATLGLSGHVELRLQSLWPIELGVRFFRERGVDAPAPDEGSSRFELMLASIATCPWSPSWLPALAVCAGFEAGRLHAEASGFAVVPPPTNSAVANVFGGGVLRLRLTDSVHLRAGVSAVLPLVQHEYTYRSASAERVQIYRMPQIAARLEIGAGVRF